jgi:hypothetical protein
MPDNDKIHADMNRRLARIVQRCPAVEKAGWNDHTKKNFVTLDDILVALTGLFLEEQMVLSQPVTLDELGRQLAVSEAIDLETGMVLRFASCLLPEMTEQNAQRVGSAITYARRYMLTGYFGITDRKDDDGHMATHGTPMPAGEPPHKPNGEGASLKLKKQFAQTVGERMSGASRAEIREVAERMNINPDSEDVQTWHYALSQLVTIGDLRSWLESHRQEDDQ